MRCVIVMVFGIAACGGNGEGGGGGLFGADAGQQGDATTTPGTTDPALEGSWRYDACTSRKLISKLRYAGNDVEYTHEFTDDSATSCAQPFAIMKVIQRYTLRGASNLTPGATKIDYRNEGITLLVTQQSVVDYYNQNAYCGRTDWQVNVARDVTGRTCSSSDGSVQNYNSVGHMYYDIYKVDAGKLFVGSTSSGTGETDALRPTQLTTSYWSKQ